MEAALTSSPLLDVRNDLATPEKTLSAAETLRAGRAAKEFEALVLAQFLAPLFSSVETPGLAGGGPGQDAFEGLLQEEYAKAIAERGGFGIADNVKAALIGLQSNRQSEQTNFRQINPPQPDIPKE